LYLCNVGLSKEACELVAEILTASVVPAFKTLHFYNNMSGSGGAAAIATVLRECHSLKDFRFSATRSSSDGCLALADVSCYRH
jgi:Ran GTPase-activating protein 1